MIVKTSNTLAIQLATVFKNLKVSDEFVHRIVETLNAVHQDKMAFHDKEFDKITAEQKKLTKMMDNLYLDKLRRRITESDYDKYHKTFKEESAEVDICLAKLKEAEDNYYITAKYVLDLTNP